MHAESDDEAAEAPAPSAAEVAAAAAPPAAPAAEPSAQSSEQPSSVVDEELEVSVPLRGLQARSYHTRAPPS